ncbi:MAG: pitrilysin family protein [Patescibacteria group bacterium]
MNVNDITLKNGLKVRLVADKNSSAVTIHLKGLAGSNFENESQIGSAHILEHLHTSNNFGNKLVSNGGRIIGVTSRDDVLFMVKVQKNGVIDGLEFLSKVFAKEQINNEDFSKLKRISLQEIKRIESNPEKFLGRVSCALSFPNERMSKLNIGEEKHINKLSIKNVTDFRDKYYHPNNFALVLSGNISINTIVPYIKSFFSKYKANTKAVYPKHRSLNEFIIKNYEFKGISQILIKIDFYGFKTSDDKKYSSLVISNILDSLLNKLIKERLGLSYITRCVSFSSGSYGLFSIYFSCAKKDLETILHEIRRNVISFSSLISSRSIENSKKKVLSNLSFEMEKVSVRAEYNSDLLIHGRKDQNYQYEVERIKKCLINEIRSVSQEIFSQKPKITVVGEGVNVKEVENTWL